jgi:hypothetical protein
MHIMQVKQNRRRWSCFRLEFRGLGASHVRHDVGYLLWLDEKKGFLGKVWAWISGSGAGGFFPQPLL